MNDSDSTANLGTIEHLIRDEAVCDRFEAEWQAGNSPRIEDFLEGVPPEARGTLVGKLIALDEHYRRESYRRRFPEWACCTDRGTGDRYSLVSHHARGGMGRVSIHHDRELCRRVALKEMHPELASSDEALRRFLDEARITGRLEHPNVVPVYELVKPARGRTPFYTMRFVSGRTLTDAIRQCHENRREGKAVGVEMLGLFNAFVSVCQTVAYAHTQGVIHRDLKGGNIMLGEFGEVIVLDWGLAKVLGAAEADEPDSSSADADVPEHTQPGVVKGPPGFLSPEAAAGRVDQIGPRTDVYGLGAILYEILTGRPPFIGTGLSDLLDQVLNSRPVPPRTLAEDAPAELEAACLRALARDPDDRHPSAAELAAEVKTWLAESANRSRAQQERERFFDLAHDLLCTIEPGRNREMGSPWNRGDERIAMNLAWEKTFGWTRDELLAFGFLGTIHPDDFAKAREALERVARGIEDPRLELRCRCKDGTYRCIRWTAKLIPGERLVYAVGHDITEMKTVEAALRRSTDRFELAVRGSGVGIWDWDCEAGESWYSPRWKSMLGYEDHEIGHNLDEWESRLHPDDRDRALAALRTCTEGDAHEFEVEYRMRHKDGTYRWILDRGVAVRNESGVVRMAGAHTDITDRRPA
jgi:PAS domain S-box-containing protein